MKTVLICGCLWGGFWTQFAVSVPFNMPSIHVLSGGRWYDPDIMFYRPSGGPLPFSIAGNFLLISVFGSLFAVVVAWLWTKEAGAKWRMRFAVWLFSAILVIWSVSGMLGEEAAWTAAENDRVEFREWLTRYPTDTYAKKRIEEIDRLLKLKPPSNHD
ncbi:MAG: hypothetical protein Q7R22_008575 [Verrucomicrobiota bacterium JB025]|nr:hypothetical protein [Verrucomicrobiota bacterium JB025]